VSSDLGRATAHRRRSIAEARGQLVAAQCAEPVEGSERRAPDGGFRIDKTRAGGVRVTDVTREGHLSPALCRSIRGRSVNVQLLSSSESVVTTQEIANADTIAIIAPASTVRNPVLPSAHNLRQIGARRYDGTATSTTANPDRGGRLPRGILGAALAVFRRPRHRSANMARPAIHAARVVKSVSDTQQQMVLAEPVVGIAPNPRHRWWAFPLAGFGMLVLATLLLGSFFTASRFSSIPRPYAIVPSDAEEVQSRITLDDVQRYPADGRILFVTIRQPELSLLSWLMFRHDDDISPRTYEEIYGSSTPQQLQVRGRRQMFNAQQAAEYVALSKLGFPIERKKGAIVVDQIICFKVTVDQKACEEEAPSGDVLQPDDELISVDGEPIKTVDDLTPILAEHEPGDMVKVAYTRPGVDGNQTGEIELIASPDDADRTIIGFYPFDTTTVGNAPFPITIATDGIGGPSAGLAFTLTLIDELTPGELTGGNTVAVTGEIDINGNVGAIGGLAQKASAVRQTGTDYFIVPASQSPESLEAARAVVDGEVEIIPVATLDEALAALADLGGNADDLGQPGLDYVPAG